MTRVHQCHDAVERKRGADRRVDEEGLGNRPRIGEAGRFQHDPVEALAACREVAQNADQIAADRAADAAVVELEDLLLGVDHQLLVDADLAELILDHRDALTVAAGENPVQQRRLARTQKARQYSDRNPSAHG